MMNISSTSITSMSGVVFISLNGASSAAGEKGIGLYLRITTSFN
jgi:hypothetical protein